MIYQSQNIRLRNYVKVINANFSYGLLVLFSDLLKWYDSSCFEILRFVLTELRILGFDLTDLRINLINLLCIEEGAGGLGANNFSQEKPRLLKLPCDF